ncbi:2-succinyl-6-hydroxy-2,4-cyclohexadiene-1-carboxylate synthase [Solibacillus sp. R5-41]|uniref:2-succinyl-6-hydroxy-2, 4-cyclohexadiene-1-carboxylate synthase n=1 Tax=Solibacillus sp. R5-41 TaxID=2048654 RepID=UPI000C12788D|nr:2-succinyl-6-hydroxy-2,4-cyclohexadiene-1-carboxylate synthase [Solibacillus sp. R5-41]ATP41533.1 2-succinyl-6-hydroxy-2,4-cyclohexadiene-1-carboxylate synthase [Solibacillus sp. R5-41]
MARVTVNEQSVHVEIYNELAKKTLVLLHGFTGSTKTWQHVVKELPASVKIIAIDLIGHGQSTAPQTMDAYSMEVQIQLLEDLFEQLAIQAFTLVGYSMGGRVALSYTARFPKRVTQLILESASPGLEGQAERLARKNADDALADKIAQNGLQSFIEKWENIPLFASQKNLPQIIQAEIRNERMMQREIGLANSLRGMGTGVMPALWNQLQQITMPVTLITGELDKKFITLNEQMQQHLPKVNHIIVPAVGHAIHVENPTKFATIVKETISQI